MHKKKVFIKIILIFLLIASIGTIGGLIWHIHKKEIHLDEIKISKPQEIITIETTKLATENLIPKGSPRLSNEEVYELIYYTKVTNKSIDNLKLQLAQEISIKDDNNIGGNSNQEEIISLLKQLIDIKYLWKATNSNDYHTYDPNNKPLMKHNESIDVKTTIELNIDNLPKENNHESMKVLKDKIPFYSCKGILSYELLE